MSEVNNVNAGQEQKDEMQSLLTIQEHEEFNPIVGSKYLSAKEFCETVSSMFKVVFADYEGCIINGVAGTTQIEVKLFFNHNKTASDLPVCCSKEIDEAGTQNPLLAKTRRYNARMTMGDRYFVTEEGQATLAPLLINNKTLLNSNGTINWGKICSEVADTSSQFAFEPMRQQYTAISFIDPVKLIELIYGTELVDEANEEHKWVYNLGLVSSIPTLAPLNANPNSPMNWMLRIDRISEEETAKLARRYGLSVTNGLEMVR